MGQVCAKIVLDAWTALHGCCGAGTILVNKSAGDGGKDHVKAEEISWNHV